MDRGGGKQMRPNTNPLHLRCQRDQSAPPPLCARTRTCVVRPPLRHSRVPCRRICHAPATPAASPTTSTGRGNPPIPQRRRQSSRPLRRLPEAAPSMPAQDARRGPVSLRFPRLIWPKMNDSVFLINFASWAQCVQVQGSLTWHLRIGMLKRKKFF